MKKANNNGILRWDRFLKAVLTLAVPVALQNLLTNTGSMIDTMMIGSLGEETVGAVGLCAQFSSLLLSCYWGFLGGGILFLSQYWGAKDEDGINRSYGLMTACMTAVGLLFGALAVFAPEFIMSVYTDKEVFKEIGVRYFKIVGFAYPLQVFSMSMSGLLRSTERVRIPLIASICSVLSNIFLNWVFIFGKLGCPAMGVRGAALATVCAALVNVLVMFVLAKIKGFKYLFMFRAHLNWKKSEISLFLKKCFPIVCNELGLGIAYLIINMVLGRQEMEAVSALAVFRTFEGLIIAFFTGFSSASSVMVGMRVGAGEHEDAFIIANRLVYLCAGTVAAVCLGIYFVCPPILTAMGLHGLSMYYGRGIILIFSGIAVLRMANWISNDTCRASGDVMTGTIMEVGAIMLINVPIICLAGLVWHWPFFLVFIMEYIDEPFRFVLMQIHMHSGGWVRPVTEAGKKALPEFRKNHPLRFFWTRMGLKENKTEL